ncbi:MAG: class I SAM-dependent rRNA methyltransferase [Crocinitomicaceae bacterium]
MNIIAVRKNKTHSIDRRHPWIFSGAIYTDTSHLKDGDLVTVTDHEDYFIARGHFQHATIAVRILSFHDEPIDSAFFRYRIKDAVDVRLQQNLIGEDNNICRLVHGEGDSLPGLIVDYYAGVAVVQCHSIGMFESLKDITAALINALGDKLIAVYSKSSDTLPDRVENEDGYLYGDCPTPHVALENGVKFNINWVTGQKTGFFIDQRENRLLLGKYAEGKTVLNTFCYSGGFSLLALQHGATKVDSLDSSKKAIELTEENISLNHFEDKHTSIVADAMVHIKSLGDEYDIIVLDPPAFAKHRDKRHKAIQ